MRPRRYQFKAETIGVEAQKPFVKTRPAQLQRISILRYGIHERKYLLGRGEVAIDNRRVVVDDVPASLVTIRGIDDNVILNPYVGEPGARLAKK